MHFQDAVVSTGIRLRELRRGRGISQRQLADAAELNVSVVSLAEKGRDARLSTWLRLFAALGHEARLDVDELCEEAADLMAEEADRRRERCREGLCTGKRRF